MTSRSFCALLLSTIYILLTAKLEKKNSRCVFVTSSSSIRPQTDLTEMTIISVSMSIFYTTPAIVVSMSCVISVVVLTRKNRNVRQRELQQSRNRATVTILLFALLYGVCNIPLVIHQVLFSSSVISKSPQTFLDLYKFDKHTYYRNATVALLPAANSAANPILYFWRMPALREYIMSGIRRMLGPNREVRRPAVQQAETQPCKRVVENINIAQRLSENVL